MALNFYLNQMDNDHKIKVQCNASFTSKIDDFDVGTLTLEWKDEKDKIFPYTKLFIEDTTNSEVWSFVVISDDVKIVKKTPTVLYAHNLTVMQNTYEMTTQIVRNSVFTQPIAPKTAKFRATGTSIVELVNDGQNQEEEIYLARDEGLDKFIYTNEKTFLSFREKIKRVYLDVKTLTCAYRDVVGTANDYTMSDGRDWLENIYQSITFIINKYDDENTLIDSLTVTATNGKRYVELDKTFFDQNYWYEITLDFTVLPTKQDIPGNDYRIITFSEGIVPPVGESWKLPSIQTLFECSLIIETYYYTLGDVIRILNKQVEKEYNSEKVKKDLFWYSYDEVLDNTIAPNLTFTSQNLWNCVADVLKYIDAIPFLTETNVLTYEYLNDYGRTAIEFDKVDENSELNSEHFTNSLIANYQNAKQENAITYPAENLFKRVSSKVYGVPGTNDYEMRVDKPIDYINQVLIRLSNSESLDLQVQFDTAAVLKDNIINLYYDVKLPNEVLDISSAVYEQSIYSLLPMGDEDDTTPNQLNTLYYIRNSSAIYLGGIRDDEYGIKELVYTKAIKLVIKNMFGIPNTTGRSKTLINSNILPHLYNLQYCIKYHAIYDGRVSQESTTNKHMGETYVAQDQGGVNLNRMGNNMQGLVAKLGNEREAITIPVTEYGSRIKKGSLWVDDDGKKYIANTIKTTFSTSSDKVIVEAEFSRNFNLLSQYTKIDQEKRFYEINNNLISKGYENITEYIYFSCKQAMQEENTAMTYMMLDGILKHSLIKDNDDQEKADFALINTYEYENDNIAAKSNIYIPFHAYGLGNSICFEMGFESPINAADSLTGDKDNNITLMNKTCLYTPRDGFADTVSFKLYGISSKQSKYATEDFPNMTSALSTMSYYSLFEIIKLKYFKKPNEILHLNYSIAFMPKPDEEIFFGDTFINRNPIIRDMFDNNPLRSLYLYAGDELYSIKDNKVLASHRNHGMVNITYTQTDSRMAGYINFEKYTLEPVTSANAWAIGDSEGNIYFAVNQRITNTRSVGLYFAARRNRF